VTPTIELSERLEAWLHALEARQLADLTFQELSRSVRALSSAYVERRSTLARGSALSGAGKRAAFALFYGPLHFLLVHHIVQALGEPFTRVGTILDLGCGTGASGAAWALACDEPARLTGIDRHPWAVEESRRTLSDLQLRGSSRVDDLTRVLTAAAPAEHGWDRVERYRSEASRQREGVLLAYSVNEVSPAALRSALLDALMRRANAGARILVVEPLAGNVAPWWESWATRFTAAGGWSDEWRVPTELPHIVEKIDRAAGLNHRELKGRSLAI
jgi:hypothetical protein